MKPNLQTMYSRAPSVSRWLILCLFMLLVHISLDHQIDIYDTSPNSGCDICYFNQVNTASSVEVTITLEKYIRTEFNPIIQFNPPLFIISAFARAPPTSH